MVNVDNIKRLEVIFRRDLNFIEISIFTHKFVLNWYISLITLYFSKLVRIWMRHKLSKSLTFTKEIVHTSKHLNNDIEK